MKLRSGRTSLAATTAAVLVVGGAATAIASDSHSNSLVRAHNVSHERALERLARNHLSPRLLAEFRVFGQHARVTARAATLDTSLVQSAPLGPGQAFGLNPTSAFTISLPSGQLAAVYPGASGACVQGPVIDGTVDGHCMPVAGVEMGGLRGTVLTADGSEVLFGVVPNGQATVTVTGATGVPATIPVTDNTYVVNIGASGAYTLVDHDVTGASQTWSSPPTATLGGPGPNGAPPS